MIIINFKTYESGIGENAVVLAKACEEASLETNEEIVLAVSATDIFRISQAVKLPIFGQHTDDDGFGAHTGEVIPETIKAAGAKGTILNHSEHRIPLNDIGKTIKHCKELGLICCVCARDPEEGELIAKFKPDMIAVEPPELIGGDISISKAKPNVISESVRRIKPYCNILVGAGVKTPEDVRIAKEMGADGILIASGITKAKNPKEVLLSLMV